MMKEKEKIQNKKKIIKSRKGKKYKTDYRILSLIFIDNKVRKFF